MSIVFLAIFVAALIVWLYKRTLKPANFPPGPPRWPILGSITYLSNKFNSVVLGLRPQVAKYGRIVGYYVGNMPIVLVADYNTLREICKLDSMTYRPSISPYHLSSEGSHTMQDFDNNNQGRTPGIVFSNGRFWREQRKFLLKNLRQLGFGKSSIESLVDEQIQKLCNHLKSQSKNGSAPVSVMQPLKLVIINILWTLLFGEQRDIQDPQLAQLIHLIDEALRFATPQSFISLILPHPVMTTWPILRTLSGVEAGFALREATGKFVKETIRGHRQTFDENNLRGFVDQQLLEIQRTTDPKSSFYGERGLAALHGNVSDIFVAGQDTTSSSILWALLYLLHHPEVQTKIHDEFDEVLGRGNRPGLKDRDNLHYFNAVILESHRAIGHVPLGVIREAQEELRIGQYVIPRGAMVQSGLYFIMNDPERFPHPEEFNPDRFIDPVSKTFKPDDWVIPFGLGKRDCVGQSLGEQEFYLFLAGILSEFEVRKAPGSKLPSMSIEETPPVGMVRSAPKFEVLLIPRL